jgi:hypothetical protein
MGSRVVEPNGLRRIWCEVLQVSSVVPEDDFYDCGGGSLLAVHIAMRITDELGVEVSIDRAVAGFTFGEMCEFVVAQCG